MKDRATRAALIAPIVSHPAWAELEALAEETAAEHRKEVFHLMESYPDKLTGKTAIAKSNRAKGIEDFFEEVRDLVNLLERK